MDVRKNPVIRKNYVNISITDIYKKKNQLNFNY